MSGLPKRAEMRFSTVPKLSLGLFVAIFIFAVPWWWRFFPEAGMRIRFGAPTWAVTAVIGSLMVSCVAAWSLHQAWARDEAEQSEEPQGDEERGK